MYKHLTPGGPSAAALAFRSAQREAHAKKRQSMLRERWLIIEIDERVDEQVGTVGEYDSLEHAEQRAGELQDEADRRALGLLYDVVRGR